VPPLGKLRGDNPCGEQPLLPYDVCNPARSTSACSSKNGRWIGDGLRTAVCISAPLPRNVIDREQVPARRIDDLPSASRRLGLGIMGWADLLVRLGMPYNSDGRGCRSPQVMEFIDEGRGRVEKLAEQRGTSPSGSARSGDRDATARGTRGEPRPPDAAACQLQSHHGCATGDHLNHRRLLVGYRPLFAVAFIAQSGRRLMATYEDFVAIPARGWYSEDLMQQIARRVISIFDAVPEPWQRVFVTGTT